MNNIFAGNPDFFLESDAAGKWGFHMENVMDMTSGLSAVDFADKGVSSSNTWLLTGSSLCSIPDSFGEFELIRLTYEIPDNHVKVIWEGGVYTKQKIAAFCMSVVNCGAADVLVNSMSPVYLRGEKGAFAGIKNGAENGWQAMRNSMWMGHLQSHMQKIDDRSMIFNYHVSALCNANDNRCVVAGMGERTNTVPQIGICKRNAGFEFVLSGLTMVNRRYRPLRIKPGAQFKMNRFVVMPGCNLNDCLEAYGDYLARYTETKLRKEPYSGIFCAYGQDASDRPDWYKYPLTFDRVSALLDIMDTYLKPYGIDYIKTQFGGLSSGPGDIVMEKRQWSSEPIAPPASSPGELADIIEKQGFTPDTFDMAKHQPDGVKAMAAEVHRRGYKHALVCRGFLNAEGGSAERDKYAAAVFKMAAEKWGYDYIMLDFNSADFENDEDDTITMAQSITNRFAAVREAVGDDIFIESCMNMPGVAIGIADGYRPACDWRGALEPELVGEFVNYYYLHKKIYQLDLEFFDPDMTPKVMEGFGPENGKRLFAASIERVKSWTSFSALSGYSYLTGGVIDTVTKERWHIFARALPVYGKAARPADLLSGTPPSVFELDVDAEAGKYKAVGLFNWSSSAKKSVLLDFGSIRLNRGESYLVYDFWDKKFFGVYQDEISVDIPASGCKVFFIHAMPREPKCLGNDRHVTGAIGLKDFKYDNKTGTITGISEGPAHTGIEYYIYIPSGQGPKETSGCECEVYQPSVLRVSVDFGKSGSKNWSVSLDALVSI
ncbi:MAG: hypothetical protein FWD23_08885 [Oscillospiraceae bacterium]|nr:hypothetical protein [Oscillospiraceae bacterium]